MKFKKGDIVKVIGNLPENSDVENMKAEVIQYKGIDIDGCEKYHLLFENGFECKSWTYEDDLLLIKRNKKI